MKTFLRKKIFIIIIVTFFVLYLLFFFTSSLVLYIKENILLSQVKKVENGLPMRLKIQKIGVDAAIEYVGLTLDGSMDVPKGPDEVAWFSLGTRLGEEGSVVIAGHTNWKNGRAAVFDNLYKLKKGDQLSIEGDKGKSIYLVREIRTYDRNAYAPEVFTSDNGKHLNLITCTGSWDKKAKSSTKRLVVFTDVID